MAQTQIVQEAGDAGLIIAESAGALNGDDHPVNDLVRQCRDIEQAIQRGHMQAAFDRLCDLTNEVAQDNDYTGGAWQ